MTRTPRRTGLTGLLTTLTVLGVALVGCSSGADTASTDAAGTSSSGGAVDGPEPAAPAPLAEGADDLTSLDSRALSSSGLAFQANGLQGAAPEKVSPKSVISTGNVALRSPDVAEARFDVQKVVDRYAGEVTEEQTDTDKEGEVKHARLVVRIPTADFRAAIGDLEQAADLISSDTNTDDVTMQVIDIAVRLRVQRRSILRVETLLDRAQNIRDIIAIEAQLSRRQAVLNSLERRQSYLADQTKMSTVTVSLERTPEKKPVVEEKKKDDATGFVAGLKSGWSGLSHVAVGAATVAGAALPFLVLLLVLLVPGLPLGRRLLRRRTTSALEA
ncbi:DUF4349 domain-containing protein [Nocardioides sp. KIGAM211]|uniref:DUF4349 domain-containing protein n=1 Tax=Nocardioides luti TaxID=2761101 RepID=A0A7X0RHF8_9ACTN|nr:DUF4349 domain-containing protein [Nocardioides luti]MBB6627094.1 DUF4349 domain-containing protein [Nocardioides luti]